MGTFHHGKSELHGITVAVDTNGEMIYVGRCDDMDDNEIILLDVDEHKDGTEGRSKGEFLKKAAKFGHWKKHERLILSMTDVATVKPLGEVSFD